MVFVLTNSDSTMAPPNKNPGLDGGITKRPCGRFCRCQSLVVISWRCQPQDFVETKLPFLMGKSYETTDIICARRNSLFLLKLRCFCFLFGKRMLIYIYIHTHTLLFHMFYCMIQAVPAGKKHCTKPFRYDILRFSGLVFGEQNLCQLVVLVQLHIIELSMT